ncbi:hypothetical protein TNCV_3916601 [Trichonephila clavipes]|nr:hypothetical protein TNCV_3916601 [Trichonephila clavipes]
MRRCSCRRSTRTRITVNRSAAIFEPTIRKSLHFAMARTKQTESSDSNVEIMDESNIESETIEVTSEQACHSLHMLWGVARSKEVQLTCTKAELAIQEKTPIYNEEYIADFIKKKEMLELEQQSVLGEISLITCPIENCQTHNPKTNSNINPKKDLESVIERVKSKQQKRAGDEEFKLPKKAARTIKEIPIEQVVCTSGNKFSVLEEEEVPPGKSSNPPRGETHHAQDLSSTAIIS